MACIKYDVFISYRRKDAEAHARMLFNDLSAAGYSAFYDHISLGAGNFVHNIEAAVKQCQDFIVILSQEALGERIFDPNDTMRREIATAFSHNKRIIGIILSGFDGFPKDLPEELAQLPHINCLYAKMEYYEAMLSRLMSGQFLSSQPHRAKQVPAALQPNKAEALAQIANMSPQEKYPYMRLLLDLSHEFNSSPECMRFYRYIDLYDRNRGIRATPPYQGNVPTDLATYLSFFETLYLILITKTLDIAVVDELYRFRFFAACNNPTMQASELLPLGHQYPNILALYDLWSEYIRKRCVAEQPSDGIANEIPQFERDLHKRYHIFQFAHHLASPREIRLIDRHGRRIDLVFRRLATSDLDAVSQLQDKVVASIPNNQTDNIFEPLTEQELAHSLRNDIFIGVYHQNALAAMLNLISAPTPSQNLLLDLDMYAAVAPKDILVVDCVLSDASCRGFGLQSLLLDFAYFLAQHLQARYLCATVSPKNPHSAGNFIKSGYRMVASLPKYHSIREYFVLDLAETSG